MTAEYSKAKHCPKTVAVLGASYGGFRAAQLVAAGLPKGWRVVLIDRNSHANHVYILPRLSVLPGHEHKAFIPYDNAFLESDPSSPYPSNHGDHLRLHAQITSVAPHSLTLSQTYPEYGLSTNTLHFDYAIYALGSHLPTPIDLWGRYSTFPQATDARGLHGEIEATPCYDGTKKEAIDWLKQHQKKIEVSSSVLIVGGGALGVQYATDISAVYPMKDVTLLHSRHRLLPRFDEALHTEILQALETSNVKVILGERLDLQTVRDDLVKCNEMGQRIVQTMTGRQIATDLVLLCTGQTPNTGFLKEMDPATVDPKNGLAHVLRTMQLGVLPSKLSPPLSPTVLISTSESTFARAEDKSVDKDVLEAAMEQIVLETIDASALDEMPSISSPGALGFPDFDSSSYSESPCGSPSSETTLFEEVEGEFDLVKSEGDVSTEIVHDVDEETPYPHIFVVGDAADAFGAIKAGHTAYYQAEVAANNILKLIKREERLHDPLSSAGAVVVRESQEFEGEELERYTPGAPAIKVSLGLTKSVYQVDGIVGVKNDGHADDLHAALMWAYFGMKDIKEEDMYA